MGRSFIAAVAAALFLVASPAKPAEATEWPVRPICTGQSVSTDGRTMSIIVTVVAVQPPPPAIDYIVICGVYVNGVLIGQVTGTGAGVLLVGTRTFHNVPIGPVSYCVEWDTHYC